jgi:hypothetical protein
MPLNRYYSVNTTPRCFILSTNSHVAYLRLHGVKARDHPVFTELTRVKQYFEKIKRAENPVGKRENMSVDKDAAARIIKAGLVSLTRS